MAWGVEWLLIRHPRIAPPELLQHRQQQAPQSHLTGADGECAALQLPFHGKLPLGSLQVGHGGLYMGKEPFPLRCQPYASVGPGKQLTAKLAFQQLDDPGHIGLVGVEQFCGTGDAPTSGGMIEHAVVVERNFHIGISILISYF